MASAGWYPDPSGQPGLFRYWDGAAWTPQTTTNPYAEKPRVPPPSVPLGPADQATYVPASEPAGPQYGSYGQGGTGWTPPGGSPPLFQPPPTPSRSGRAGLIATAVVLVVLLVAGGVFIGLRTLGGDDTATDPPTPAPTSSGVPTTAPTAPTTTAPSSSGTVKPTGLECKGGNPALGFGASPGAKTVKAGGLQMPVPSGYDVELNASPAFTFADEVIAPSKQIQPRSSGVGWISTYALGSLDRTHGFGDLQQAAGTVLSCMTASKDFYQGFSGRTDLDSGPLTLDGHDAWQLDAEVRVDLKGLTVDGDVAKVIVVDTDDPASYGMFVSVVPIGDDALLAQQQDVAASLKVR